MSPYLLHRSPSAWQDAEAFRPERWQLLRPRKPLGSMALLQGMGPNGCFVPFGAAVMPVSAVHFCQSSEMAWAGASWRKCNLTARRPSSV